MNTSSMTARTFEVYLVTGAMYYIACVAMIAGLRLFEKKAFCW